MANKFNELLKNKLHPAILEEKEITFEVSLPISDYKKFASKNIILQKMYSARDFEGAKVKAKEIIINNMGIEFIPLSIDIVTDFKKSLGPNSIYTVTVSGMNTKFLRKLKKVKF